MLASNIGPLLVAFGDDLEEQVGLVTAHRQVAGPVDDQHAWPHDVAFDEVGQPVLPLGSDEGDDRIGGGDEARLHAGLGRETTGADREMGLADAGRSRQHDVPGAIELLGHVLLVQRLDRLPVQPEFPGHITHRRLPAASSDVPGKPLRVERVFGQKVEPPGLHLVAGLAVNPANREGQPDARVAAGQVTNTSLLAVRASIK